MKDESKTKARLIQELNQLRRRVTEFEAREAECRQVETSLRSATELYQTLIEESFDGIFVQKGARIAFVNGRLCEMLGYEESELIGLEHWRVYHPDYQELTRARAQARLRGEEIPARYEVRLQRKDGSSFDGEIRVRAMVVEGEPGIQVWVRDMTDLKRAEAEIRQQGAQLRAIMDSMQDGVNIIDADYNVQYVNPLLLSEYGRPDGKKCYQYFHRFQDKCRWCRHEETLAGRRFHWEWTAPKSGRTYDLIDTPLHNADGTVSKLQIWRDVTDRLQAEAALRESEERLHSAMESAADPFVVYDMEGRTTYVNPAFTRLFGWTREELLGKRIDFVPPELMEESRRRIYRVLAGEPESHFETRRYTKTGEVIEVSLSGACYRDRDGRPLGLVASLRDITASKRAEEALRESEYRLRLTFDEAPIGAAMTDPDDFRFLRSNNQLCRFLGYTEDELKRLTFQQITHPEDLAADSDFIQRMLRGEIDHYSREKRYIRKDGQEVWGRLSISLVRDDTGAPLYFIPMVQDITDRKRAEAALRESEDRYRQLVEVSPDCVVVYQNDQLVFANPAAAAVLGAADQKELLGKTIWEVVHPDFHQLARNRIDRIATRDEVLPTVEYRYVRVDGRPVDVEARARRFTYQGQPALLSVFSDVTERKRKEAALRESERKYEAILRNVQDGYYEVDLAGNFTFFNESNCRILGYPRVKMMGMNYRQYSDEENARKVYRVFNQVYRTGQPAESLDWQITRGDGSPAIIESSVSLRQDAEGNPIGFRGMVRDVTERKRSEEALRDSEQRLSQIVNFLPDATFVIDLEGKVIAWNQAIEDMTGIKAEDMLGQGDYEYALPFYGERRPVMIDLVIKRDQGIERQYQSIKAEGDRLVSESFIPGLKPGGAYLYNTARTLYDAEGRIVGAIESIRDVTDIKRAEEEKAKLTVQIQQSQKMEAIGTLAGGIAHDFNNILAAVMGYADLALDNARAGRSTPRELEQVLEAAERAKSLVRQILTFSRKVEAHSHPMDLNRLVRRVAGMLERTIPKMIEIELRLSEDLRAIQGDDTQLEQVLINLGTNAVDAMPDGGQLLIETQDVFLGDEYCRTHMEVEPGRYVWLRVSDTGVGMDQQTISQIYDPFFTTKEVGRGTGLGLALVYGIVKDHGGHITCYSEAGSGTIFNIYLPALKTNASGLETTPDVEKEITGGDETILVVDDEDSILEVARDLLERRGYTVVLASRGEEALEIYRERGRGIDLIILDLGMPGMGGHKTLKRLLELDPKVKVVIASGYSVNGLVKDSLAAGAAGYIGKPYRLHDMLHKVRDVLDG